MKLLLQHCYTHKSRHHARVAHVALERDALRYRARHNGGGSGTERPVEEEQVPAAVAACVGAGVGQCKVARANEGVGGALGGLAKGEAVPAARRPAATE